MELDVSQNKETPVTRKRRCSNLEEAVITIIETSCKEKRKRIENDDKPTDITKDSKEPISVKEVPEKTTETKPAGKIAEAPPKPKEYGLDTDENKSSAKTTRIKVISIAKVMQSAKPPTPKGKDAVVKVMQKPKQKVEKSNSTEKDKGTPDEKKSLKRRNSKGK